MGQRQQVAPRCGTVRPVRCAVSGIEPLTLGIETLQHRQAFGQAFDQVGFAISITLLFTTTIARLSRTVFVYRNK